MAQQKLPQQKESKNTNLYLPRQDLPEQKLPKSFFNRHAVTVARELPGNILIFNDFKMIITETEAYRGLDDEASHAFIGSTPRSFIMFGEPGYSYVYLIYGMYHCFNIVTEEKSSPGAVLIRGGILISKEKEQTDNISLNGPGKICRHLGITRQHNAVNLIDNENFFLIKGTYPVNYQATPRIGIKKSVDKLWRFIVTDIKY